jgi:hypothetical protein
MKAFGIRGLLVLCVAAFAAGTGCGGDEDTTAAFIGEWQFTSGTVNTQCPTIPYSDTTQLTGDKFRIGKGVDAPLTYSETDTNCVWKMNASGNTASIMPSQSCMFRDSTGSNVTAMFTAGTFTVTGNTAMYSGSQNATVVLPNGATANCTSTGSGGLSKVSQ